MEAQNTRKSKRDRKPKVSTDFVYPLNFAETNPKFNSRQPEVKELKGSKPYLPSPVHKSTPGPSSLLCTNRQIIQTNSISELWSPNREEPQDNDVTFYLDGDVVVIDCIGGDQSSYISPHQSLESSIDLIHSQTIAHTDVSRPLSQKEVQLELKNIVLEKQLWRLEKELAEQKQKTNDFEKLAETYKQGHDIILNEMQFQVEHGIRQTKEIGLLNNEIHSLKASLQAKAKLAKNQNCEVPPNPPIPSKPVNLPVEKMTEKKNCNRITEESPAANPPKRQSNIHKSMLATKKPKTVIIGDSMIRGTRVNNGQNFVYGGAHIDWISSRLDHIIPKKEKPQNLIIHVGTVDIEEHCVADIKNKYHMLARKVRETCQGTTVYFSGIFHRGAKNSYNHVSYNSRINQVNDFLKDLCNTFGYSFIDNNVRSTVDYPNTSVLNHDHLHLNGYGKALLSERFEKHTCSPTHPTGYKKKQRPRQQWRPGPHQWNTNRYHHHM